MANVPAEHLNLADQQNPAFYMPSRSNYCNVKLIIMFKFKISFIIFLEIIV